MARVIGFNNTPQVDFSNGNSLLQLADLQRQNTFKSAEETLNRYSKAVKDKNTALIQHYVNQFKPEELNTDTTKQSINDYINQMNKDTGNMVNDTIYKYIDDRKDVLNKRIGDDITNTNNNAIASMNNIKAKENQENYDSNLLGSLAYIASHSTNPDEAQNAKLGYENGILNANGNVRVGALLHKTGLGTQFNKTQYDNINSVKPLVENQLSYNFDQSMRFKDVLNNPNSTPEQREEASKEIESLGTDTARLVTEYNVHPEISQSVYNTVAKAYESYKAKEAQQVFLNGLAKQKVDIAQQNADTSEMKTGIDMVNQNAKFNVETINARAKSVGLPDGYGSVLVNSDGSFNIPKGLNELSQFIYKNSNNQNKDISNEEFSKWYAKNVLPNRDKLGNGIQQTLRNMTGFFGEQQVSNIEKQHLITKAMSGGFQDSGTRLGSWWDSWEMVGETKEKLANELEIFRNKNMQKNKVDNLNGVMTRINIMASTENLSDVEFVMRHAKSLKELGVYPMLPKNLQFAIDGVLQDKK